MASRAYSRIVPDPPTTLSNTIGTEIQLKGKDFDQRLVQGGHKMATLTHVATADEQDGKHCVGVEEQSTHDDGGYWTVWSADGLTPLFRVYGKDNPDKPGWLEPLIHGAVTFKWVGKNVTTGVDPGHKHTQTYPLFTALENASGPGSSGVFLAASHRWAGPDGSITRLIVAASPSIGTLLGVEFRKTFGLPGDVSFFRPGATSLVGIVSISAYHAELALDPPVIINDGEFIIAGMSPIVDPPAVPVIGPSWPATSFAHLAVVIEG